MLNFAKFRCIFGVLVSGCPLTEPQTQTCLRSFATLLTLLDTSRQLSTASSRNLGHVKNDQEENNEQRPRMTALWIGGSSIPTAGTFCLFAGWNQSSFTRELTREGALCTAASRHFSTHHSHRGRTRLPSSETARPDSQAARLQVSRARVAYLRCNATTII